MLVPDGAGEAVVVGEALAAGQLPHAEDAVLLRVQHLALLPHGLGVRDGRLEVAVPGRAPEHLLPVVVAVRGVGHGPGDQGVARYDTLCKDNNISYVPKI